MLCCDLSRSVPFDKPRPYFYRFTDRESDLPQMIDSHNREVTALKDQIK